MDRRHFLMSSAAALGCRVERIRQPGRHGAGRLIGSGARLDPSEGRGRRDHIQGFSRLPNVEVAAVCDVDEGHLDYGLRSWSRRPAARSRKAYTDFRKLLEDKSIDAISIATPNHWHTLMTIWALPGRQGRVRGEALLAQHVRSAADCGGGAQVQPDGAAGKPEPLVGGGAGGRAEDARGPDRRCLHGPRAVLQVARHHRPHAGVAGARRAWTTTCGLGPAPKHEFTKNRFHYNWHWFWDYGNGDLGNQGIHEMDIARWGLGVKYPSKVTAIGGHFMFDDDQETPNTLNCAFEFDEDGKKKMMEFEVRHWMSNDEATVARRSAIRSRQRRRFGQHRQPVLRLEGLPGHRRLHVLQDLAGREQEPGPAETRAATTT